MWAFISTAFHNTIYYHFPGGVEDLALYMLDKTAPLDAPDAVLMELLSSERGSLRALHMPENLLRWRRLYLLLHCGAEEIEQQAQSRILESFLLYHRIDRARLTKEQERLLDFIYSGMTGGLLKAYVTENDPTVFPSFLQSPLGKAILDAISTLPRSEAY